MLECIGVQEGTQKGSVLGTSVGVGRAGNQKLLQIWGMSWPVHVLCPAATSSKQWWGGGLRYSPGSKWLKSEPCYEWPLNSKDTPLGLVTRRLPAEKVTTQFQTASGQPGISLVATMGLPMQPPGSGLHGVPVLGWFHIKLSPIRRTVPIESAPWVRHCCCKGRPGVPT